ncbi:PP0621 family protein [Ramlibacter sp. 2FC]|uniref:PP0621 family protein n=1 Tax=Ramlibacter sp. 2FC TaxID=2502188 RepID=UPI0010F5D92B|nr:PP0621 family protein [Ramlibacter sp. 2FC]
MKYLLVLLVVLVGAWGWRQSRQLSSRQTPPPDTGTKPPAAQEMTRCALCALHLPKSEAVQGRRGLYCCAAHRQQAEG